MPFGYLIATGLMGVATAFTLFPQRRVGMISYRIGVVVNELPFLALALLIASTALAFAEGDISSLGAWLVVVLAALIAAGLVGVVLRPQPSRDLRWASILLTPLWVRRGDVRRVANRSYGPHGTRNLLDVYHHRARPQGGPALVYAHGGNFRSGHKNREARLMLYELASLGWVCVSINYRLRTPYPAAHDDYALAIQWLREHAGEYGGDASTLYVSGSSAGAHMAAMAALRDSAIAGAVCLYGYYGPVDGTAGSSPVAYVRPDAPPFFVAHGDCDTVVPVEWARAFIATLQGPVECVEYRGAQHGFDLFRSIRNERLVKQVVAFTHARE